MKKVNILLLVIIIAFLLRLIYIYTFANKLFSNTYADSTIYHILALKIISGNPPQPPFFWNPLYPYFLAMIYGIFGFGITQALLVQVILDAITTFLIFSIGNLVFSKKIGFIAAFIYAISATAIFYSGTILFPTLLTFLFTGSVYLVILAAKKGKRSLSFLAGLVFGVTVIGRGNVLLPAIVPFFVFRRIEYLFGLILPILGLFLVNLTIGNDFVITTYNLGINSYIGNNPDANGTYKRPEGLDLPNDPDGIRTVSFLLNRDVKKSESSAFWVSKALNYVKNNPLRSFILTLKKIYLFWGPLEVPQAENFYFAADRSFLKYLPIGFWIIVPLFFISMFSCTGKYPRLISVIVVCYFVSFLPFFIISRFRHPILPSMIILSTALVIQKIKLIKQKNYKCLVLPILFIAVALYFKINNIPQIKYLILETRSDHASWLYSSNHPEASHDSLSAILREDPNFVPALVNLGHQYFMSGNYPAAKKLAEKALSIEPSTREALVNLGVSYITLGKPDSGRYFLKKAKEFMPYYFKIDSMIIIAENLIEQTK